MSADDALEALGAIEREFAEFCADRGGVSESDTRAKLIDRVLREVCEWPEAALSREDHHESGYSDYVLVVRGRPTVVVEAKREGVAFEIPVGSRQRTHALDGALLTQVDVRDALTQVRRYADDIGSRYAIATNGYSWIVFRAIRDDMPWRKGKARVFPSLQYIAEHFTEFWNLLSYEAIGAGSLENEFSVPRTRVRNLYRVNDRLFNSELPLQRNRLHAQLEPLIRHIFAEIADQDELEILQSCYIHSQSMRIVAHDLNCVITDSAPAFLADEGVRELQHGEQQRGFESILVRATEQPRGELILLLGGIGAGKTTFLKRYQRTVASDLLDTKALWFHIDFLKAPLDPLELEQFVFSEMLEQVRSRYTSPHLETRRNIKRVFAADIEILRQTALRHLADSSEQFERELGPYLERWRADLARYVPGLLKLCKPRRDLAVVLFVDNVDQLAPAYQANVFLLAQRVTRLVECVTVVSLREESYYAASIQRAFTAYANRKFHIASPLFRVLIDSRIRYALAVLDRSQEEMNVILPSGIELDRSAIADFLRIVKDSIFQGNRGIARFIEAICFGNMRLALQMFTTFLTSGATAVDKMLAIYRRDGAYYVAYHEFVKSIMLGDRMYYREEQSPIMNVFDCGIQRNSSHFTALRLIELLASRRGEATVQGQGYMPVPDVITAFEDTFDNLEDCVRVLNRLVVRQLVEVNTRSTESVEGATHVRLTSAGWYYRRYLVRSFAYLDLVLQDTPVDDPEVEEELRRAVRDVDNLADREDQKASRLDVRFSRVGRFLDYLAAEEAVERDAFGLADIEGPFGVEVMAAIISEFEKQRAWIRRRVQENRERFADETFAHDAEEDDAVDRDAGDELDQPDEAAVPI